MHRKVLLSDANIKIRVVAGLASKNPKVLCCPIMNSKDEVIGIFALIGATDFSREDVRLARAICVKTYSLIKKAGDKNNKHYTRHTLLQ